MFLVSHVVLQRIHWREKTLEHVLSSMQINRHTLKGGSVGDRDYLKC